MSLFRRSRGRCKRSMNSALKRYLRHGRRWRMQWRIEFYMDVGFKLRRSKSRMLLFTCVADCCANLAPVNAVPANCHSSQAALHWAASPLVASAQSALEASEYLNWAKVQGIRPGTLSQVAPQRLFIYYNCVENTRLVHLHSCAHGTKPALGLRYPSSLVSVVYCPRCIYV